MNHLVLELLESTVAAPDGELGTLHDVYFDDDSWSIHSLAVATADWLPGLVLLLAPRTLASLDRSSRILQTHLTRATVQENPVAVEDNAVSRQREAHHGDQGPWHPYWLSTPSAIEASASIAPLRTHVTDQETGSRPGDPDHGPSLRSARTLMGYEVRAGGEKLGELVDFVVRDDDWKLTSLVVGLPGTDPQASTLVECGCVTHISWNERWVRVDAARAES